MSNNPPSSNNNNMPTSFVNEGRRLATSPVTAKPITKRRKVNDNAKNDNDSKGKVKANTNNCRTPETCDGVHWAAATHENKEFSLVNSFFHTHLTVAGVSLGMCWY